MKLHFAIVFESYMSELQAQCSTWKGRDRKHFLNESTAFLMKFSNLPAFITIDKKMIVKYAKNLHFRIDLGRPPCFSDSTRRRGASHHEFKDFELWPFFWTIFIRLNRFWGQKMLSDARNMLNFWKSSEDVFFYFPALFDVFPDTLDMMVGVLLG